MTGKAKLEYDFAAERESAAKVMIYCIPTHAMHAGLQLRYEVNIDSQPASTVDIETPEFSQAWSGNVLHATAIGTTDQQITAGKHTLTIRPLDPGLVFDKIAIDLGDVKPSYLGPP